MYNVPTYTKFGLHRVPRTDHRRKSRTPCISINNLKHIKHSVKMLYHYITACTRLVVLVKLVVSVT